jgi:uncharacterized membrane protein
MHALDIVGYNELGGPGGLRAIGGKQSSLTPYLFGAVIAFPVYAMEYVAYAFLYPVMGAILAKPALMLKQTEGLSFLLIALLALLAAS